MPIFQGSDWNATALAAAKAAHRKQPSDRPEVIENDTYAPFGWTMTRVQFALEAIDRGEMGPAYEQAMAMSRDATVKHGKKLRRDTLAQVPFFFEKPDGLPQDYFDEWTGWWPRCWPRNAQGLSNGFKIDLGLAPLNVTWALREDKRYYRPRIHTKEPGGVEWYEMQRIYRFRARVGALMEDGRPAPPLRGKDEQYGLLDMWPLDGTRWLMLQEEPLRPHHHGAARSLAVAWHLKNEALRWHSAHNRKHGIEWIGAKIPAGQRESDDAKSLLDACVKLENGGVVPLPQEHQDSGRASYGLEVFAAKTEASRTFISLYEAADAYIRLLLLGSEEGTQGGVGNNAKARTQDRVSLRLTKGDCASIIEVHDQLARTACEVNGLDPDDAPQLFANCDVPEDDAAKAEQNHKNAAAGQAIAALIEKLDASNSARAAAKQPLIVYEPDYLIEQVGLMLTRAQDGEQTRPK